MTGFFKKITLWDIAGIGTILIVFIISQHWVLHSSEVYIAKLPILYIGFLGYLFCFYLVTRVELLFQLNIVLSLLVLQLLCAFFLMINFPIGFLPILTIIWVSIIPYYFPFRFSITIMTLIIIIWFTLYSYIWEAQIFLEALLYGTFHFFAILTSYHTIEAEKATEKANRLNKELETTQQLLAESSKLNERTRIARDLHDLLGHHLTALIINLQVAERLCNDEAKEKIEECHSLSKLLLSDVREAVSKLRENSNIDFEQMVQLMVANIPTLEFNTKINTKIPAEDLSLAKNLIYIIQEAITNSLKHSGANRFWITLTQSDNYYHLELYDNGKLKNNFIEGNGIKGMKERVSALNGNIELIHEQTSNTNCRMRISLSIPKKVK